MKWNTQYHLGLITGVIIGAVAATLLGIAMVYSEGIIL